MDRFLLNLQDTMDHEFYTYIKCYWKHNIMLQMRILLSAELWQKLSSFLCKNGFKCSYVKQYCYHTRCPLRDP